MSNQPEQSCDLVMKGGVTSGIVYPPAVLELQKHFTFKNIGGTSAGAMAAAATAASEFNRANGKYQELLAIHKEFTQDNALIKLFQPQPATRALFEIVLEILYIQSPPSSSSKNKTQSVKHPPFLRLLAALLPGRSGARLATGLQVLGNITRLWTVRETAYAPFRDGGRRGMFIAGGLMLAVLLLPSSVLLGFVIGNVLSGGTSFWIPLAVFVPLMLLLVGLAGWLGLWIGRVVGGARGLVSLFNKENFYGICGGHTAVPDTQNDYSNLTDWLSYRLDKAAGLINEPPAPERPVSHMPLTFKQLEEKNITLKMVTSNLSLGLPAVMPGDLANYLFREEDLRKLFPDYVVDHMVKSPPQQPLVPLYTLPAGYHFLPDAEQLPIVFCTRMSLSFPVLLCAIPLYTISTLAYERYQAGEQEGKFDLEKDIQQHWFIDGGICSNFPIHFFDAWLPTRPTFGINLTGKPEDTSALGPWSDDGDPRTNEASVYLMRADEQPNPEWRVLDNLFAYVRTMFGTAQNYRDTLQSQLPGYRERIIQIRLDKHEGGLHLTMDRETIEKAAAKGGLAAQELREKFNFEQHWWVRFLVLMGQLEEQMERMQKVLDSTSPRSIQERIRRACVDEMPRYPYAHDQQWCEEAIRRIEALQDYLQAWQGICKKSGVSRFFREDMPMPTPVLRVTPEL